MWGRDNNLQALMLYELRNCEREKMSLTEVFVVVHPVAYFIAYTVIPKMIARTF
jgi:hypothetical protein